MLEKLHKFLSLKTNEETINHSITAYCASLFLFIFWGGGFCDCPHHIVTQSNHDTYDILFSECSESHFVMSAGSFYFFTAVERDVNIFVETQNVLNYILFLLFFLGNGTPE